MSAQRSPEVSVIIPVYCHTSEHETYLAETLDSVARQIFRDFEIVLVDDASPCDIAPILRAAANLPGLRVLRNQVNIGHAASRNLGIRQARASLVAFLDHDDLWMPEKLEVQVAAMQDNPDAVMTFCRVEISGEHPAGLYIDQTTVPQRPGLAWMLSHNNSVITVSAAMAVRQSMLDIGLFDPRYSSCDDFDAWIKLRRRGSVLHTPDTSAVYRLHSHNVNYAVDRLNDNRLLTRLIIDSLGDLPPADKIRVMPTLVRKLAGRIVLPLLGRAKRPAR